MRVALIFLLCFLSMSVYPQRVHTRINFDWKFSHEYSSDIEKTDFNDDAWETVHLPHDASISGPFFEDSLNSSKENGFLPRQKGWYRKSILIDDKPDGRLFFLEFEGVYRDARIFVNGTQVAHQLNGYEGFEVNITEAITQGVNIVAVSYDNTDKESSRWYNGEGIYRDVWLKITNDIHINFDGIFVQTSSISDESAKINIQTEVVNETDAIQEISLVSEVFSSNNKSVGKVMSTVPVSSGETYVFDHSTWLNNPKRWSIEEPNLYTVKSMVLLNGQQMDTFETNFGIRTIEFDPDRGLLLNNKKVLVKGVNLHHDLGPLGAAAFERGIARRLEGLKRLGCNGVRLSHNPHDKYVLDWCDKNGMLVFGEAFDKWDPQFFGAENNFEDHWRNSLEAFIKRDRNHPSIFIWSVGNETRQQRTPNSDFGVSQMKAMKDFVYGLDPTRKVTAGMHPSRKSGAYRTDNYYREGPPEMVFYMDVGSYNYREEFWPMDRSNYPQLSFILSEAQVGNLGNEWFNFNHDYAVGIFYWGGTDYIGESFGWPAKGWPNGIIDWNDHWKPFSYYINSLYSEKPMVHIAVYEPANERAKYWNEVNLRFQPMFSHWNWQGKDSVRLLTFSNAQEVELFVNNKSMGVKKVPEPYFTKDIKAYGVEDYDPDNPINTGPDIHKKLEWLIPYQEGTIRAESRVGGKSVSVHELKTAGSPHKIVLEADRSQINANGLDLSYITVKVTDQQGVLVPFAENNIIFEISGEGVNAGVGNADILTNQSFQANERRVFQGKALLIVRSTRTQGKINIVAKSKGLQTGKIEIITR